MRDLACSIWMKDEEKVFETKAGNRWKSTENEQKIYTFPTPKKSERRNILMNIKYCILYAEIQCGDRTARSVIRNDISRRLLLAARCAPAFALYFIPKVLFDAFRFYCVVFSAFYYHWIFIFPFRFSLSFPSSFFFTPTTSKCRTNKIKRYMKNIKPD